MSNFLYFRRRHPTSWQSLLQFPFIFPVCRNRFDQAYNPEVKQEAGHDRINFTNDVRAVAGDFSRASERLKAEVYGQEDR